MLVLGLLDILLTSNALLKLEETFSNKAFPRRVETVGKRRAPQSILVADTGSDNGGISWLKLVSPSVGRLCLYITKGVVKKIFYFYVIHRTYFVVGKI